MNLGLSGPTEDEPLGGICLRAALTEQEREDSREAAEAIFAKLTEPISADEFVEMVLVEAEARARRRQMLVVKNCPHCGEVLP